MPNIHSLDSAFYILQVLVSAFLAVLFLQSGLDKVIDRLDEHCRDFIARQRIFFAASS